MIADGWNVSSFQDSTLGCNAVSWASYNSLGAHNEHGIIKRLVTASCDNSVKLWKYVTFVVIQLSLVFNI